MSSSAGIKTGWEITKEFAELEAQKSGANVDLDIETWWTENKGVPLTYSTVMEATAPTLGQRQALLRSIIEPTEADRQAGLKIPNTSAPIIG